MNSLILFKARLETRLLNLIKSRSRLAERVEKSGNDFTTGWIQGQMYGLDGERHTLEILLKDIDNLIEQSRNLDVEPQNSPVEQPSFLLCAKVNNEQNTSIHL